MKEISVQHQWKESTDLRIRSREQGLFPISLFHVGAPAKSEGKSLRREERRKGGPLVPRFKT